MDDAALHESLHRRQLELMGRLAPRRDAVLDRLQESVHHGYVFPWRVAEAPALVPRGLFARDLAAMRGLVTPFLTEEFRGRFQRLTPERYRQPAGHGWFPRFVATDYSRVWDGARGAFRWCSPEIQSFPANAFLKPAMLQALRPELPEWSEAALWLDPRFASLEDYHAFLRRHLLDSDSPEAFAIVELDLTAQKTVVDMMLALRHVGGSLVDLRDLEVDPGTLEVRCRRRWELGEDGLRRVTTDRPRRLRRLLCRALPEEIDTAAATEPGLRPGPLRRLFHDTVAAGTVTWVVHPQDFFVLGKASLVGHPTHEPPLRPLEDGLAAALEEEGLRLGDGVIKPAAAAGGRGLEGFHGALDDARLDALLRRQELERARAGDAAERAAATLLWQERYRPDAFERARIPGYRPAAPEEADPIACELRIMWAVSPVPGRPLAPELVPLCGLTRWSRLGDPANAGWQRTPFTGTQAILIDDRP